MARNKTIKKYSTRVKKMAKIRERVEVTKNITKEVDSVNKIISNTLYLRNNLAVDMKNFSLISVTSKEDLY